MTNTDPESIWDGILSRNPTLIKKTWLRLSQEEQRTILDHLIDMANKTGWMNQQTASAKIAIDVIAEIKAEAENPKK